MVALTGRERILRSIAGESIDRIPVAPFIHVNFLREFYGIADPDPVLKTIDVYEEFELDLIHRNCTPAYDDLDLSGENWECTVTRRKLTGKDEDIHYRIRTPEGPLSQVIAIRWSCPWDCEVAAKEVLIKDERDFDRLRKYQPPVSVIDTESIRRTRAAMGERGIAAPWIQGIFNLAGMNRALGDLALDPLVRPEFYETMMEYFLERNLAMARQFAAGGADLLSVGINMASGKMFDPGYFSQYVRPYEKRLFETLRQEGIGAIAHNCGCARNLLPLYPEMGMTVYESLTPAPHGDTAIGRAVEILGPHMALMGGIDQIDLLRKGSPGEIERAIQGVMDETRGRCRYILATTDYFNENTPADNIRLFSKLGRKYGEC